MRSPDTLIPHTHTPRDSCESPDTHIPHTHTPHTHTRVWVCRETLDTRILSLSHTHIHTHAPLTHTHSHSTHSHSPLNIPTGARSLSIYLSFSISLSFSHTRAHRQACWMCTTAVCGCALESQVRIDCLDVHVHFQVHVYCLKVKNSTIDAVCFSALQCVVVCCSVLQCVAVGRVAQTSEWRTRLST